MIETINSMIHCLFMLPPLHVEKDILHHPICASFREKWHKFRMEQAAACRFISDMFRGGNGQQVIKVQSVVPGQVSSPSSGQTGSVRNNPGPPAAISHPFDIAAFSHQQ
jgi:hypothetical protein